MGFDGKGRSSTYENLAWVKDDYYGSKLLDACNIESTDVVCDIGTGTGYVAYILAQYCKRVVGIDSENAMLERAKKRGNIEYVLCDIEKSNFITNEVFDLVVARMSMHHMNCDYDVIAKAYEFTDDDGRIVIAEGIPQEGTAEFYKNIFDYKEKRNVYTLDDLVDLVEYRYNIENIEVFTQKDMSIKNWLENSCPDRYARKLIFAMHLNADDYIKKAYNMRNTTDGDIIMDWRTAIVSGRK